MTLISTPFYKITDVLLLIMVSCVSHWIRFDTFSLPFDYAVLAVTQGFFVNLSLHATNFYTNNNSHLDSRATISCWSGVLLSLFIISTLLYITKTGELFSRQWIISNCIFGGVAFLSYRRFLGFLLGGTRNSTNIIVVGSSPLISTKADAIRICGSNDIKVKFFLPCLNEDLTGVVNLIEEKRLDQQTDSSISEVWINASIFNSLDVSLLERTFSDSAVKLVYLPLIPPEISIDSSAVSINNGLLAINSTASKQHKMNNLIKIIEDKALATSGLILLSPAFLIISILIKLDSHGPIFFRQNRYGIDGKEFKVWKFRTMHSIESDHEFKQATNQDPRVTKIGATLRKTSLDELPQLINVLQGNMSLVGPRPHPNTLNEKYRPTVQNYMRRHTIKPGITGLAQIRGCRGELRNEDDMRNRIKYDLFYINNWSLLLDIKIILGTVHHLLTTKQAY